MIFTELMQVQNATLPIEPNMDLVNTVRVRVLLSLVGLSVSSSSSSSEFIERRLQNNKDMGALRLSVKSAVKSHIKKMF